MPRKPNSCSKLWSLPTYVIFLGFFLKRFFFRNRNITYTKEARFLPQLQKKFSLYLCWPFQSRLQQISSSVKRRSSFEQKKKLHTRAYTLFWLNRNAAVIFCAFPLFESKIPLHFLATCMYYSIANHGSLWCS